MMPPLCDIPAPLPPSSRLAPWVILSLVLHGCLLAAPWLAGLYPVHPPQARQQLVLDLTGLLSNRQLEQQAVKTPQKMAHAQPRPQVRHHPKTPPVRAAVRSPASVAQARPVQPDPESAPPPAPLPAVPRAVPATQSLMAQTIAHRETEEDILRRYLARLRSQIQRHLVYPPEARQLGEVGATVIRFTLTETGAIAPGSLEVRNSSGSPTLDEHAILAAQDSAPFLPPPHSMDVQIGLSFTRD